MVAWTVHITAPNQACVDGCMHDRRWAETQRVLASLVPPEAVHCSHKATGFTEGAGGGGPAPTGSPADVDRSVLVHFQVSVPA